MMIRMRKKTRIVGFYKDKTGETRPVTKSEVVLKQKRIIQQPRSFSGIRPKNNTIYLRALRLLENPNVAMIAASSEGKLLFNKPATIFVRNHAQGLLTEGKVDKLALRDVKGNVLFDSEVRNPKASKHWFVVVNGDVATDFRSKTPIMKDEAMIVARDLFSRQMGAERKISVRPD